MATGDQTLINFPRETTMQEIAQALQTMAFTQSADLENISTWGQLSGPVSYTHLTLPTIPDV